MCQLLSFKKFPWGYLKETCTGFSPVLQPFSAHGCGCWEEESTAGAQQWPVGEGWHSHEYVTRTPNEAVEPTPYYWHVHASPLCMWNTWRGGFKGTPTAVLYWLCLKQLKLLHWPCLWLCKYEPLLKLCSWEKAAPGAWQPVTFFWLQSGIELLGGKLILIDLGGILKAHTALKLALWTCCGKDLATLHRISLTDFLSLEGENN